MNARQRRFVDEYLIDLNATQAAIRAGYSEKTARAIGAENLTKPDIVSAIDAAKAERAQRTTVTADYVVANLREVVERCMERAPVMVREGRKVVQKVDEDDNHVWQFDARGANGALGLLGKHLAMFTEKQEVTFPQGGGVLMVPAPIAPADWAAQVAARQAALVAKPDA